MKSPIEEKNSSPGRVGVGAAVSYSALLVRFFELVESFAWGIMTTVACANIWELKISSHSLVHNLILLSLGTITSLTTKMDSCEFMAMRQVQSVLAVPMVLNAWIAMETNSEAEKFSPASMIMMLNVFGLFTAVIIITDALQECDKATKSIQTILGIKVMRDAWTSPTLEELKKFHSDLLTETKVVDEIKSLGSKDLYTVWLENSQRMFMVEIRQHSINLAIPITMDHKHIHQWLKVSQRFVDYLRSHDFWSLDIRPSAMDVPKILESLESLSTKMNDDPKGIQELSLKGVSLSIDGRSR